MFIFSIKKQNRKYSKSTEKGYAILYTVVIISIIMTISIGLSNAVNKQLILSSVARDSQAAFYQADTAVECALNIQFKNNPPYVSGDDLPCGLKTDGSDVVLTAHGGGGIFTLKDNSITSGPCFEIFVDESNPTPDNRIIKASGYSDCNSSSIKRVERTFEVKY